MFGFGLKLKAKPKPTISAVRRPRDPVVEAPQKNDSVGQTKQSPVENSSQNSVAEQSKLDQSEKSAATVVSNNCAESVAHGVAGHLKSGNIVNTDSEKNTETPLETEASSSYVISHGNDTGSRSETAIDENISNSTSIDSDKLTNSKNEANNLPVLATISEPLNDCNNSISKTTETAGISEKVIQDEVGNQLTNEKLHVKESSVTQSSNFINPPKELPPANKPILERSADKENTICNDDDQIHNPGNILQNIKKKKPRAQGTFLQMTIEAKKELDEKLKDGKLDKSKLIMRDLIHYNPTSNPMSVKSRTKGIREEKKCKVESESLEEEILSEQIVDDVEATRDSDTSSMPVPQLKVGPDGKIMLDSSSLVIETTGTEKSRADLQNSELVEENEFSGFKYRKRRARRNDWSPEETLLFYKALNDIGADFSMMERLFPNRTRRDLKLKFKKEEKTNLSLVDKAMTHKCKFNFEALEAELTRDREERSRKKEEEARLKEIAKKELQLQKIRAKEQKANEKQLKLEAEKIRKLKDIKRAKQIEDIYRKSVGTNQSVKRTQKMSADKEKQEGSKKPRRISSSDSKSDDGYQPKYSFEKPRKRSDDDLEHMRYDTIFKTTKSGRRPKVRKTLLEENEEDQIRKAKFLMEKLESGFVDSEGQPQHSDTVNPNQSDQMEINLFEDLPIPEGTEYITQTDEDHDTETSILSIGSRLHIQNLPETIKIVEELTNGISSGTVSVNGVMCNIIALDDDDDIDEFDGGSSAFQVEDTQQESNSNCCIRLESVQQSAETGCEQLSYVINFDENNGESLELTSKMITGDYSETYILPEPHSDHSYSMNKSHATDADNDRNDSLIEFKSYVVLEPHESVEIYNDS